MIKKFVLPAVVLVALAGAGFWHFHREDGKGVAALDPASGTKGPASIAVEAEKVTIGSVDRAIEAVGNLASNESVTLSPEITGRITEILFAEGQAVKAGDPLIRLDDVIAKAELAQIGASLTLSQANYERAKTLFKESTGTGRARDEALAKLQADQAGVDLAKARLEKTLIKAPFDGIIGLRNVSIGDYVNPGQDLVNLESIAPLKVDFRMPEIYLSDLKTGQTIEVGVDAFPGKAFRGEVYAIDPLVDSEGRTAVLRAKLPNADGLLRPGLFARVNLLVSTNDSAIIIPEQALIPQGNERFVYKIVDAKAIMTPVKTGTRRQGQVEVTEGLTQDDVIVTAGQMKLRPDSPVTILPTVAQTAPAAGASQ
jgi:membrane fusion protein (multidrug efflux system)